MNSIMYVYITIYSYVLYCFTTTLRMFCTLSLSMTLLYSALSYLKEKRYINIYFYYLSYLITNSRESYKHNASSIRILF